MPNIMTNHVCIRYNERVIYMPMSRIFSKNEKGEDVLICAIDLDTEEVTYYVSQEALAEQRDRIRKKVGLIASDMAKRDPTAALFHLHDKS